MTTKNINEEVQKLDINIKRLIQSCESLINDTNNTKDILAVEKYVSVLYTKQRQLRELIDNSQKSTASTSHSNQKNDHHNHHRDDNKENVDDNLKYKLPTKEVLNEYSRKIDVLFSLVNQEKLSAPISNKQSMIRLQSSYIPHSQKMNEVHTILKTKNKEEKKKTDYLLNHQTNNNNNNNNNGLNSSSTINSPSVKFRTTLANRNNELKELLGHRVGDSMDDESGSPNDASFNDITQQQRQMQTDFTTEMVSFSRHLKEHGEKMSIKLQMDNTKVDEISGLLVNNHSKIEDGNIKLKQYTNASSRDTLNYIMIVVLVILVFMGTYMFIKFNSKHVVVS